MILQIKDQNFSHPSLGKQPLVLLAIYDEGYQPWLTAGDPETGKIVHAEMTDFLLLSRKDLPKRLFWCCVCAKQIHTTAEDCPVCQNALIEVVSQRSLDLLTQHYTK